MRQQAIRLMVMGTIDVILGILVGIYGVDCLCRSDALLAIFLVWITYNVFELVLPVSSR